MYRLEGSDITIGLSRLKQKKQYGADQKFRIASILLLSELFVFLTPFQSFAGLFFICSLGLILFTSGVIANKRDVAVIFISCLFFCAYLYFTPCVINTGRFTQGGLGIAAFMVFYACTPKEQTAGKESPKSCYCFDLMTLFFLLLCYEQLARFAIHNIDMWQRRLNTPGQTFFAGYHHVDFSVVVFSAFMLGMKRGYTKLSFGLAAAAWIILPARTFRLCIISFFLCYIFRDLIYKICRRGIFRKSITWMIILVIGIIAFSYIWIFVLGRYLEVAEGHTALYDDSNFGRFQTILYSASVILHDRLFLNGLDLSKKYGLIVPDVPWAIDLIPHNSYYSLLLHHSVLFGGYYLFALSRCIDRFFSKKMIPYIIPYLLAGCILHDMFIGGRMIMYLIVLIVPFKNQSRVCCFNGKVVHIFSV